METSNHNVKGDVKRQIVCSCLTDSLTIYGEINLIILNILNYIKFVILICHILTWQRNIILL